MRIRKTMGVLILTLLTFVNFAQGQENSEGEANGSSTAPPQQAKPLAKNFVSSFEENFKDQLRIEMAYIISSFKNYYAPGEWKKNHLSWDATAEGAKAFAAIDSAQSMYDVRRAAANFLKSTQDYHVGFRFNTDEAASLPFMVRTALDAKTGKQYTIVVAVNPNKVPSGDLRPGVRLVKIDGVEIEKVYSNLISEIGMSVPVTDMALADIYFTNRQATRGMFVPQGNVEIEFQEPSGNTKFVQMYWEYNPPTVADWSVKGPNRGLNLNNTQPSEQIQIKLPLMMSDWTSEITNVDFPFLLGARKSYLPDFGPRIWSAPKEFFFDAYIYKASDNRLIGVVRSPSYSPPNGPIAARQFAAILQHMQQNTDALVIDQLNNPGGSLFLVYAMTSMLTDRPMSVPKNFIALTDDAVGMCGQVVKYGQMIQDDNMAKMLFGPELDGFPVSHQFVMGAIAYCRNIIAEKAAQRTVTSTAYHLYGVDKVMPSNFARYTKGILVLVNELDFSGGDWFPTILQDSQRGLPADKKRIFIMGTRTAGAGGYIQRISGMHSAFGLNFIQYTGSLAIRADGKSPIENLGVTPDILMPTSVMDYMTGFSSYVRNVQMTLSSLMNGKVPGAAPEKSQNK